jgi:hypothetical protein
MDWGSPVFVLAIIAVCYGGWILNNMVRAKHGYPLEDEWGGKSAKPDALAETRKFELLSSANDAQQQQIARLEERIAVLERIATDKSRRLADDIDRLS